MRSYSLYRRKRLRQSIDLTRKIADRQERDTRDSIAEAARAANAMRDAAAAALSQVQVMIAKESPIPYLTNWRVQTVGSEVPTTNLLPAVDYSPALDVKNIGNSSLQIQAVCIEIIFGQFATNFPQPPQYNNIITSGIVIAPNDQNPLQVTRITRFTKEEIASINNGNRLLWLYGFVRYYNQYLREEWDAGFSVVVNPNGSWVNN